MTRMTESSAARVRLRPSRSRDAEGEGFSAKDGSILVAVREDDRTLLLAGREGDPRAWEKLVERYERLVFSIPLSYGLPREDAADVAQLVFTILFQSVGSLPEDSRLGPWLSTVARRHTWRLLERRRREGPARNEDLAENVSRFGRDEADPIARWEAVEWLEGGLARVDERCRELLLALYFDPGEPSYADISARLGMPVGSIGPTRARCLRRLRKLLEDE
jgi:RNA polymerase sigma factor (sigma-70 family)